MKQTAVRGRERMSDLITPDELTVWVPGEVTVDSAQLGWEGVRIRGYRYTPLDVPIPGMQDYIVVAYKNGATTMNRRSTGDWRNEPVAPGCVSLLTHAAQSHWRWNEDIEVTHLYLSPGAMADVAAEAYQRHVKDVELRDVLKADDAVLVGIAASLAREAEEAGLGGRLYVESLRNQACVHILRRYANVIFREPGRSGGLSRAQCQLLNQYFEENLDRNLSLAEIAAVVQLSVFHFARKFHTEFGRPPHAYVMQKRIERAKAQLARGNVPLKVVAASSGFSDQSHMTRLFRRLLGVTPAEYRKASTA
jgi:AraC family transcriptional regulator